MKRCKNYINGAWTESVSGNAAPTFNPATGEELAQVVVSTPEDVDRAVAAAHTSFYETREWRDMDSQTRGDFLLRIADLIAEAREELAYLDAVDMGKPLREAEGDVDDAIHCYRYYAGLIKIGDDYYYVNSKCEVVRDCDYYISWTHDLMPQGRYHFDADGKLTGSVAPLKNGIYEEDGSLYFYRNGERTYAGLIQIDGDYYYVRSTCEVVHDRSYYVYWTHGLMPEGYYNFDSAGRMILDSETE